MSRHPVLRVAAGLLLAAAMASCAPHRLAPPSLEPLRSADRYRVALAARADLAQAVDAEASAWLRGPSLGNLPGVHARMALGAPDAFRVQVESMFGIALDFSAWGDSLACFIPSRRLGVALDAAADSFGLRSPGSLGVRVLSATWDPPAAAWAGAAYEDSLLVVRWQEAGDSPSLGVGSDGLPHWAALHHATGAALEARYRSWEYVERAPWPSRVEFEDRASGLNLSLRFTRVVRNPGPRSDRLSVRIPAGAARLEWAAIRDALARTRGL